MRQNLQDSGVVSQIISNTNTSGSEAVKKADEEMKGEDDDDDEGGEDDLSDE